MKLVNKNGLEPIFHRALLKDEYDKGASDFSATELISPARKSALILSAGDSLEVDISSKVAIALGTGWHSFIERGARPDIDIVEKRYFAKFGEYMISAQIDLLETDTGRLIDWKTTKTYPFTDKGGKGVKPEWEQQLNIQAEILRINDIDVKSLHICGVLKDHDKKALDQSSRYYMKGYPKFEMQTVDLPMWSRKEAIDFIFERIKAHVAARADVEKSRCSSKETWGGNMCRSYCECASICSQYQESKKTGLIEGENQ